MPSLSANRVNHVFLNILTYKDWCDENNEHAVSERILSMRLEEMGFLQSRTAEARYWVGVGLRGE